MHSKTKLALLLTLLGTGPSACYELPNVTIHEPGDYKGAKDPLL